LVLASAIVLLLLTYDIETFRYSIPFDVKIVGAIGSLIVLLTGIGALLFDKPFLKQSFATINIPLIGVRAISTDTFSELDFALAVVGVVIAIILSISEDV